MRQRAVARSHLAILTRLLLEQLRGQLAAHGHITSSLGPCASTSRGAWRRFCMSGETAAAVEAEGGSDDEFESDRLWCSDIASSP